MSLLKPSGLAHVLVVDDEPSVRMFATRVLIEEGFAVHEAGDGAEALERIAAAQQVALVVTDVVMPRMHGVELLERITVQYPHVRVLLMSAYTSADLRDQGISAPCGMLAKPFTADELVEHVRRCLDEQVRQEA